MWGLSPLGGFIVATTFLAALIAMGLAYVAWQHRTNPAGRPVCYLSLAISGYALSAVLLWLSPTFTLAYAFNIATLVCAALTLVCWVYFTVVYTDTPRATPWKQWLFLGWVSVHLFAYLTNPVFELYLRDVSLDSYQGLTLIAGDATTAFTASRLVILVAVFWTYWVLLLFYQSTTRGQQQQALLVALAPTFSVVVLFGFWVGVTPHPELDASPVGLTASLLVLVFALFYRDLLTSTPVATDMLFDVMDDPVLIRDTTGRIVDRNEAARRFVSDVDDITDAAPALARALETGQTTVSLGDDGGESVFSIQQTAVRDSSGRERGELLVLRNITVQKRREEDLRRENERLGEFASMVSHDLRNPLNLAQLQTELASKECDSTHLDEIMAAHDQMDELIQNVLATARDNQRVETTEAVSLRQTAEHCWQAVGTASADLRVETDRHIEADRHRLERLVSNLFRNAIEHGGPNVTVTVGEIPSGFYVEDDGPGIASTDKDRIFETGYTTKDGGTGFGLTIVERMATVHDWRLQVTASESGGARFEVLGVRPVEGSDSPTTV